jgi:hypothetical protein
MGECGGVKSGRLGAGWDEAVYMYMCRYVCVCMLSRRKKSFVCVRVNLARFACGGVGVERWPQDDLVAACMDACIMCVLWMCDFFIVMKYFDFLGGSFFLLRPVKVHVCIRKEFLRAISNLPISRYSATRTHVAHVLVLSLPVLWWI